MARAAAVGMLSCPICDFEEAEVRPDKNGHLYLFCPDCNAQIFTRGCQVKERGLKAKMRPVAVAVAAAVEEMEGGGPVVVPEDLQVAAPAPKPEKRRLLL